MNKLLKKIIFKIAMIVPVLAVSGEIIVNIESPKQGYIYTGISTIRGWAISSVGIQSVELFIDGKFISRLPQGGRRADVGNAYPTFPESENSGFAFAFNYASLPTGGEANSDTVTIGYHEAMVKVTDNDGAVLESVNRFGNSRFLTNRFITDDELLNNRDLVNFDLSVILGNGPGFMVLWLLVDGMYYDVLFTWLGEAQQPQPYFIVPSINQHPAACCINELDRQLKIKEAQIRIEKLYQTSLEFSSNESF
jgi:hypothetical protein